MTKVLVLGDRSEKIFTDKLCRILSGFGGVLGFYNDCVIESAENNEFLLFECEYIERIDRANVILVFKSKQHCRRLRLKLSEHAISIVGEENERALQMLNGSTAPVLTCGMSSKDTLTLSSVSENNAVVSLQREIRDFNGNIIEPCEIQIIHDEPFSKFELLAACAVLLLAGKIAYGKIDLTQNKSYGTEG